jgi:hypothetical protein
MATVRSGWSAFLYRAMGAATLDRGAYEEIEHDPSATVQSAVVVIASSLAAGVGASNWSLARPGMLLSVAALALVTWIAWAVMILQIGGRIVAERQTHADLGQLLRTVGFAASPGLLQIFAGFAGAAIPVYLASWLWMLAAMIVAVRQALDFQHLGRAIAVCAVALVVVLVVAFALALLFSRAAA